MSLRNLRKLATAALGLALVSTLFVSVGAEAATKKKTAKKPLLERVDATPAKSSKTSKRSKKSSKQPAAEGSKRLEPANLRREVVFDGSTVNGQYHSAGEAVAKVEQEKKMNDLIGMRRDYKDRMAAEKERLKRGEAIAAD